MTAQHKIAIIAFICSLAFAATTVFLLCLLEPKSPKFANSGSSASSSKSKSTSAATSGGKYGLDAYEALAGLPIKKRQMENDQKIFFSPPNKNLRMIVDPLYDEWIEMGLSIRTIRMNFEENEEDEKMKKRVFNNLTFSENQLDDDNIPFTSLPKTKIPMERVLLWQDEFDSCKNYDSKLCQEMIEYWMIMNGLERANIVKHGRRNDDQNDEEKILQNSKASSELEFDDENGKDVKVNIENAKLEAEKQGLQKGFLVDTKYPQQQKQQ